MTVSAIYEYDIINNDTTTPGLSGGLESEAVLTVNGEQSTDTVVFTLESGVVVINLSDTSASRQSYFTPGPGIDAPLIWHTDRDNNGLMESYFYLTDNLGRVTEIVDKNCNGVENVRYSSFGELISSGCGGT